MFVKEVFNSIIVCLDSPEKKVSVFNELPKDVLVKIFRSFSFKDLTTSFCLVSKNWEMATESPLLNLKELREVFTFLKFHYRPRSEKNNLILPGKFKLTRVFESGVLTEFQKKEYKTCFHSLFQNLEQRRDAKTKQFAVIFEKGGFSIQEILDQNDSKAADFLLEEDLQLISTYVHPNPDVLVFPRSWKIRLIKSKILTPDQLEFLTKLNEFIKNKFDLNKNNLDKLNRLLKNNETS